MVNGLETIIEPNKTLRELLGNSENRERFKNDPILKEFNRMIRRLLFIADMRMIDYGELLQWVNRKFGYVWDTIPYCRYSEIEIELRREWFRMFQFFKPTEHDQLMSTDNNYSEWFRYMEKHTSPKEAPIGND